MLVLSRMAGEEIIIETHDETIRIVVVRIQGSKVRIGVSANPKTVKVDRAEVHGKKNL